MKIKLTDLDPHFIRRAAALHCYEHTDNVGEADGLQLQCPACLWADRRIGGDNVGHTVLLWRDPAAWGFTGHGYQDASAVSDRTMVDLVGVGPCHAQFRISGGKVDFY